jgi:hypothetical protein
MVLSKGMEGDWLPFWKRTPTVPSAKWTIPESLPVDWEMRDLTSAEISVCTLDDGRREQIVEHAPLPGVTPEMMLWMLENMGREIEWRGQRCIMYRCWHPIDHIHFEILGAFGPGCRFHIVEAFEGRPEYLADRAYDVPKLGRTALRDELVGPRSQSDQCPRGFFTRLEGF